MLAVSASLQSSSFTKLIACYAFIFKFKEWYQSYVTPGSKANKCCSQNSNLFFALQYANSNLTNDNKLMKLICTWLCIAWHITLLNCDAPEVFYQSV